MTTVSATAGATFAQSLNGPTPGQPRTAASVNDPPLKTLLNNDLAIADGATRQTDFLIIDSAHTTEITGAHVWLRAPGVGDVYDQTLRFPSVPGSYKHVFADRLGTLTNLVCQSGPPWATFTTWTSPGEIRNVSLVFRNSTGTSWDLIHASYAEGGMYQIDQTAGGTASVAVAGMREIWLKHPSSHLLTDGTYNIDLDGAAFYYPGDRLTVRVRGAKPGVTVNIRDESNNVLYASSDDRTYGTFRVEFVRTAASTWRIIDVGTGSDPTILRSTKFSSTSAATQTLTLDRRYYTFSSAITSTIQITLPDGTWIGQQVDLLFDNIQATTGIRFTGPTTSLGTVVLMPLGLQRNFAAVWDGERWWVRERSA